MQASSGNNTAQANGASHGGTAEGVGDAFADTPSITVAENSDAHELQNERLMATGASAATAKRGLFSRNTPGKQLSSTLAGLNSPFPCLLPYLCWAELCLLVYAILFLLFFCRRAWQTHRKRGEGKHGSNRRRGE
jgi:hypothetical protein